MQFAYRLAAHLGIEDPAEMLDRHSPEWLDGWIAFDTLEPLGMRAAWSQMATLIQAFFAKMGVETEFSDWMPGVKPEDL